MNDVIKDKVFKLLKNNDIFVDDEQLLTRLLDNLDEDETKLIVQVIEKLLSEGYKFHVEVCETECGYEELYFVVHYDKGLSDEEIDEDLFRLNEYVRDINDRIPWWLGFARDIK